MFKGESTLNVFQNAAALKELVDKFSGVRDFDKLVDLSDEMEKKSEKAYNKECTSDKKIASQAYTLNEQMKRVSEDILNKKKEISEKKLSVSLFSSKLEELEQNQETTERFNEVSERLKTLKDKSLKLRANISMVNKNTALLDKLWILCAFPPILTDFKKKCSEFSKEKRRQEKAFLEENAKEVGKKEALEEVRGMLSENVAELPWYLPNQETMEEMIHDHVCKVCGSPAPEGSRAYEFMVNKLNEYKKHIEAKLKFDERKASIEKKQLFTSGYVEELHHIGIRMGGGRRRSSNCKNLNRYI